MVVSGLLLKAPYWICWQIRRLLGLLHGMVIYVESEHDYHIVEYMLPHIKTPFRMVARNGLVASRLRERGIDVGIWPAFPSMLIMTRHAFHRFPIRDIRKIGMMHGPYFFKKMVSSKKYNTFDLYLFSSKNGLHHARERGVRCGVVGGYPRIDAFRDPVVSELCHQLKTEFEYSEHKITILFSATWDGSGQSAIDRWVDHLSDLKAKYNIIVSLHPMMSKSYVSKAQRTDGVLMVGQHQLYAAMLMADFMVCDTSSIIAEYCVLGKPIITFAVNAAPRLTQEIQSMIKDISVQIDILDELDGVVKQYLNQPDLKRESRQRWRQIMYDDTNISHGEKAAAVINSFMVPANEGVLKS